QAFYLGAYEVTQEEYEKVVGSNPSAFRKDGPGKDKLRDVTDTKRFPADSVGWNEAVEFCKALSALAAERSAGRSYRLRREADGEYACRGGEAGKQTRPFHFTDERGAALALTSLSSRWANFDGTHPYGGAEKDRDLGRPQPVGSYKPNAFGIH